VTGGSREGFALWLGRSFEVRLSAAAARSKREHCETGLESEF
jgi:hypothetical protein